VVLPSAPASAPGADYRPHLDGLRALAVYLVVFFHAGSSWFPGGYIGVDVFFVLSGFLVTRLLLRDLRDGGAIRFGRFYSRRFRRLLPASFVALIVTGFVYTAIASPAQVSNAVGAFRAAFLYSANWFFIHQSSDYFAATIDASPVLHFWSLAVEEQFYLLWPLLLGGLFTITRRMDEVAKLRAIRVVVAIGAVASMAFALSLRSTDPNRAYYGTDTRAYELLGGALLALSPALIDVARRWRRAMPLVTAGAVLALLVLGSSWIDFDAIERGVGVTITTCVLLLALESGEGGIVRRFLSIRPIVYLGKISYGTYLWHWLVILVIGSAFRLSSIATIAIACLVATALASLSFDILEQPVRTWAPFDRHRLAVVAAGLVVSVASAVILIPKIVDPAHATAPVVRGGRVARLTPIPRDLDLKGAQTPPFGKECVGKPATDCILVEGSGPHILLVGDSEAQMFSALFMELARREGISVSMSAAPGCPWQLDLYTGFSRAHCEALKQDRTRLIAELKPDIIVVAGLDYDTLTTAPLRNKNGGRATFADVTRSTRSTVATLRASGRNVVVVEPLPLAVPRDRTRDPLQCLEKATVLEACRYTVPTRSGRLETLFRSLARSEERVHTLDLDRDVCPLEPVCDPVIDGMVVMHDARHLTVAFSKSLAPEVDTYLKSLRLLP
jgi:peptidoglycan/LPS O-acetylase OafA/YrhL